MDNGNFKELEEGYSYTTKWKMNPTSGRYSITEEKTAWVDMSSPRPCSYQRRTTSKHEPVLIPNSRSTAASSCSPAELRGITLTQLRAVMANIDCRCMEEDWKSSRDGDSLTPNNVKMYEIHKYIVLPFTKEKQLSFVSCLASTAGDQPPRFYISHSWETPFIDTIASIEQFVRDFSFNLNKDDDKRGGGMTQDTPIWIDLFSYNQHRLSVDMSDNPLNSGSRKAMKLTEHRTLTILDKGGVLLSRTWCVLEIYLTLMDSSQVNGLWAVYTAHAHNCKNVWGNEEKREAVGIISGGATSDLLDISCTSNREKSYPFEIIRKVLNTDTGESDATSETDRRRILNVINGLTGDEINNTPSTESEQILKLNETIYAALACTSYVLRAAPTKSNDDWTQVLSAMAKGAEKYKMSFDFDPNGDWRGLTKERAVQLVAHLPSTIEELEICNASSFGIEFVDKLCLLISRSSNLKKLALINISVGEGGGHLGIRLAKVLGCNTTITMLGLYKTGLIRAENAEHWVHALVSNNTLSMMGVSGVDAEIVTQLQEKTKDRKPRLDVYTRTW